MNTNEYWILIWMHTESSFKLLWIYNFFLCIELQFHVRLLQICSMGFFLFWCIPSRTNIWHFYLTHSASLVLVHKSHIQIVLILLDRMQIESSLSFILIPHILLFQKVISIPEVWGKELILKKKIDFVSAACRAKHIVKGGKISF